MANRTLVAYKIAVLETSLNNLEVGLSDLRTSLVGWGVFFLLSHMSLFYLGCNFPDVFHVSEGIPLLVSYLLFFLLTVYVMFSGATKYLRKRKTLALGRYHLADFRAEFEKRRTL